MKEIPVYLIAGLLESGKTNFINGILEEGFAREDRTLLLCCEEGEEEYNNAALRNVTVVTVEEEEQLTAAFLKKLEKEHRPQQIIFEYNGMWSLEKLYREILPANWILYQIMTLVDARTFEVCARNMGQILMEKLLNADMIVFNRCNEQLRSALRKGDIVLLILCLVATAFGCLIICSATNASGFGRYLIRQLFAAALGVGLYVLISSIDVDVFSEHRNVLFIFNCILLLMLVPFGTDNGTGNKSWLDFPLLPIDIQPAEICKIPFVLILASVMASHQNRISHYRSVFHMGFHLIALFGLMYFTSCI